MNLPEASFKIVENNGCPLYEWGDEFKLSSGAILLPWDKPACLILIEDISIYAKEENTDADHPKQMLTCGGCGGSIGLACEKKRDATPHTGPPDIAKEDEPKDEPKDENDDALKDQSDIDTIASLLSDFSFFQSLDPNDIRELVSYLKLRKFAENECILKKGEPGKNLYIILFGKIEVVGDGNISIAFLEKSEVFGEMSLLSGDPVGATIKVVEPTTILYINGKNFRSVLTQFPSLQMYFARLLAKRLAKTNVVRSEEFSTGMVGKISDMPPSELLQTLNTNQKTGILTLQLSKGPANLVFREGGLISAEYDDKEREEAFYEILKEKEGRFKFTQELPAEVTEADEIGEFMWLLMEGVRRMDEEEAESCEET